MRDTSLSSSPVAVWPLASLKLTAITLLLSLPVQVAETVAINPALAISGIEILNQWC
ncbi:MAG: hypothetical protein JWP55_1113 [Mycobacterium sp.]|jgi:hypothetical protein|nr:hypothetical protein [Mycobacterium sp.]